MSTTPTTTVAQPDLPSQECPICGRSIPDVVMYRHIQWCRQSVTKGPLVRCKFNRRHRFLPAEADKHHQDCPSRNPAIRIIPPSRPPVEEALKKVGIRQ